MSESKYILRPMKWELYPRSEGRMSDYVTEIKINDEADGEFVTINQPMAPNGNGVSLTQEEWIYLQDAVCSIFEEIEKHKES